MGVRRVDRSRAGGAQRDVCACHVFLREVCMGSTCMWGAPSEYGYMAIRGEDESAECINVAKAGVISRGVTHTAA